VVCISKDLRKYHEHAVLDDMDNLGCDTYLSFAILQVVLGDWSRSDQSISQYGSLDSTVRGGFQSSEQISICSCLRSLKTCFATIE
jgi:hypothetical protein